MNFKFRRQHLICPYITDFCCLEKNLFQVIRFWDHEVLKETNSVLESIKTTLMNPHPDPLPKRERVFGK